MREVDCKFENKHRTEREKSSLDFCHSFSHVDLLSEFTDQGSVLETRSVLFTQPSTRLASFKVKATKRSWLSSLHFRLGLESIIDIFKFILHSFHAHLFTESDTSLLKTSTRRRQLWMTFESSLRQLNCGRKVTTGWNHTLVWLLSLSCLALTKSLTQWIHGRNWLKGKTTQI